ncbi:Spy0128 family protein, partial [Bilifractor sp. LCP19S3_H10]|uniref:Spy0128 family protein n=1 Tax=Bilifractor sp. LCP19S3_H10 TaxID=3438736 RepID=UPI003F907AEA
MKNKNTFRKWMALFLSISMVAASGITSNVRLRAAEDTPVQETTAEGTTSADTDASASENADETTVANVDQNDTTRTEEIGLNGTEQAAEESAAPSAEENKNAETAAEAEQGTTPATVADSENKETAADSTASSSVSSSSEEEDKNLTASEQIDEARKDATKREYSYEDDLVSVTATLDDPKAVPDNAEFRVTPVTKDSTDYNYDAYMNALNDDAAASSDSDTEKQYTDENTLLYDMAFIYPVEEKDEDGNVTQKEVEVQPAEGAVKISVNFKKDQLTKSLDADNDSDVEIKHLPLTDAVKESNDTTADATNISADDVKVEDVNADASVDNNSVDFSATSFSVFAVHSDPNVSAVKIQDMNLQSALGEGYDYGIVANKYSQSGDTETNVMVGSYTSSAAEVGASSNYSNAGGNDYFGSFDDNINLVRFHQSPANVYLGNKAWTQYESKTVKLEGINGSNIEQKSIDVSKVINDINTNFAKYIPAELPDEIKTLENGKDSNQQPCDLILDFTRSDAGTYLVNFTGKQISTADATKNLNIKKNDDQTIVFYCTTSGELDINDYEVNGISMNTYVANKSEEADNIMQQIIFYAPNATKLNITKETSGIFIAPKAEFSKSNTSGGVLVCDKYSGGNGEWHYHNHNLQAPAEAGYKLKAKKNFEGGTLNGNDFSFSLYNADENFKIKGSPIQTQKNESSGDIQFDNITYNQEGINYYVLKENNTEKPNVKYDSTEYHITVQVKLDNVSHKYVVDSSSITDANGNPSDIPVFNNTYNSTHDAKGEIQLDVTKELKNREFQEGDNWTFTLAGKDTDYTDPMPEGKGNVITADATSGSSKTY